MPTIDGTLEQKGTGRTFTYRIEYEVVGRTVNYKASVADGGQTVASPSGQFDFDPSKLDPGQAAVSFVQAQIDQVNFGASPTRP